MTINNDLTQKETKSIEELRNRINGDIDQEFYDDTYFLLRFLRARDFNVNNAETMLRKNILSFGNVIHDTQQEQTQIHKDKNNEGFKHMVFREKNDVKNILKFKRSEVVEKYFVYVTIAYDKEGCVVRYVHLGNMDLIGLSSSCTFEEIIKNSIYELEMDTQHLKKQSEKLGKNIDKCVYICNTENIPFTTCTHKRVIYNMIHVINLFINNYPERLKACIFINAPMFWHVVYSVAKAVFPMTILNKLHIYTNDSYKEDLLKLIDADVLPAFLGGTRRDPDGNPKCVTVIPPMEPVPRSYYLQKNKRTLAKAPGVHKTTLSRAAIHEVLLDVKEGGSYIEWEFQTKCRNIGFGLFYNELIDGEVKTTELVPIQRIDTEMCSETGTFLCESAGTYVIVFDNTYSWVRSKEIYYRTKIVTPKEHEAEINE